MAGCSSSELDELQQSYREAGDDLYKLCILIGRFRIDTGTETPDTIERAKKIISGHLESGQRSRDEKQRALDLRTRHLVKKLRELRTNQERCGEFLTRANRMLPGLSPFMTCQLFRICQDFKEQLKTRAEKLRNGKIRILVTGEVCAGKSSVSSLLMGGAYLPVDHGPCTKIPSEITHSEDRIAYLHFKEDQGQDPLVVELSYDENHASWCRVRVCIETGQDADSKKQLEKVVIRWPLVVLAGTDGMRVMLSAHKPGLNPQWHLSLNVPRRHDVGMFFGIPRDNTSQESRVLQPFKQSDKQTPMEIDKDMQFGVGAISEITFIDVPGIFDTDESFHTLYPYIRSADAFLFIINNSGPGLARDRLLRLMRITQDFSEMDHGAFNPRFSLFVCNRWDQVDHGDRDRLSETLAGLQSTWPSVTRRQLIPCVASRQALDEAKARSISEEYEKFYHKICGFIETAVRTQIEINSWWLTSFLDRSIVVMRHASEIANYARMRVNEVKDQIKTIKSNIVAFEETRKNVEQMILEETTMVKQKVKQEIGNSLKKNKMTLSNWTSADVPQLGQSDNWEQVHHEMSTKIAERLEQHIMDDEGVKAIKEEFDDFIRKRLLNLIDNYEKLERDMPLIVDITNGMATRFEGINTAIRNRKELFPYIAAGLAVVFWPLAPFVLIIWRIYDELYSPKLLCNETDLRNDSQAYMKKQTEKFIDNIVKNKLVTVTEAAVQDAPRNAKFMIAFLHNCTEKHLESVNALLAVVTSTGPAIDSPAELETLSEDVKLFVINNVLEDDIDENSLEVDMDNPLSRLGGGCLTDVYSGRLNTDEHTLGVAVKVIKWPRGEGNCPDNAFIIRELLTLQMLSHKPRQERSNFMEYHGFLMSSTTDLFRLQLVTDLYDYNLQNLIETERLVLPSPPGRPRTQPFPAEDRARDHPSWGYILYIALQAAKGLQFLHRYNVVHRDVKPSNFLIRLTEHDISVHLADVGISHRVNHIKTRGPFLGSDLYNAPEVRSGGLHSHPSDIYSFCLVLWELWYGRTVYVELNNDQLRARDRKPPSFPDLSPPNQLRKLIQSGWDRMPARRPNIRAFVTCLQELSEEYRWPPE